MKRLLNADWAGLAAAIVLGGVALSIISPAFLSEFNFYVLLRSACVSLLVAFAQMVTLGVGQMNLSVGAMGGMVAVLFGGMMEVYGVPLWLAVPLAIGIGALGGLINGLLTVRTGINGFIVTLATGSAFTGINLGLTKSIPFYNMPQALQDFGNGRVGAFPYLLGARPIIVAPLLGGCSCFALPIGRRLLAVGGNCACGGAFRAFHPATAVILAHCLSGVLAAISGGARRGPASAQPSRLIGARLMLLIASSPHRSSAVRRSPAASCVAHRARCSAVFVIAMIQNRLVLANVDPYWVRVRARRALILAAVALNRWRARPARLG